LIYKAYTRQRVFGNHFKEVKVEKLNRRVTD
jgi:hypothetical protein